VSTAPIVMPQLGVNDTVVRIVQWLVEPGQAVAAGDEIATVETSKATIELEAESAGHVYPLVEAGQDVPVQQAIGVILPERDDDAAARWASEQAPVTEPDPGGGGPQLTRRAAALAEELQVDLAALPTDRLVREDDVRALAAPAGGGADPGGDPLRRVAVYGASEGGVSAAEAVVSMGGYEVVAFLDDTPGLAGGELGGLPVWPGSDLAELRRRDVGAVATHIADRDFRVELRDRSAASGVALLTVVHAAAYVSPSARLGAGTLVKAGAVVDTGARVGDLCIIDNGATVAHDCVIADACHLAPGVVMGGGCRIGERTLLGVGTSVSSRVAIGAGVIAAPGAVIVRDVPDGVIVEGSPARVTGRRR
jgi:acetyltransferase EpsM